MDGVFQVLVSGSLLGGTYALMSIGLSIIFGVMGLVNFAQAAYMMLAMYGTYFLWVAGVPPLLAILVVAPIGFLLGVATHVLLLRWVTGSRSNQDAQLLLTWGLALVLEYGAQMYFKSTPKSLNVSYRNSVWEVGGVLIGVARFYGFVVALLMALALYTFIKKTSLGIKFRATADDWEESVYVGIDPRWIGAFAFGIGIATTAIAGALLAPSQVIEPFVGQSYLVIMFVVVVLGGLGSIVGALFGGLSIGLLETAGAYILPGSLAPIVVFGAFAIVLLARPTGLFGTTSRVV